MYDQHLAGFFHGSEDRFRIEWDQRADVDDFHVYRVEPSGSNLLVDIRLTGKAILTCVAGEIAISTSKEETVVLSKGQACFFEAANYFSILGSGTGYLALG